jgi:hypothetical protein
VQSASYFFYIDLPFKTTSKIKQPKKMKYLYLILSIISIIGIVYFLVTFFWVNKRSFSDLKRENISLIISWSAIFLMSIYQTLKHFKNK